MEESRYEEARRIARENAPAREARQRRREKRLRNLLKRTDPDDAQRRAVAAGTDTSIPFIGPVKTPAAWSQAVEVARLTTIGAARAGSTITYGGIRNAIIEELGVQVGHNQFAELVMSMNREARDGVLLSSIVVQKDTRRPGEGFSPYARSLGIDEPLATTQRHVFERFSDDDD